MILDRTGLLSENQAITATAVSTNIIDLGAVGIVPKAGAAGKRDVGKGTVIPFALRVTQTFNNLTSLIVTLEVSVDAAFTSPVEVFRSPTYPLADLVTGARHLLPDSIPIGANLRYLRAKYTVAGTAPTLGQIYACVAMGIQTNG
jgi:hypothetical protein